MITAIAARDFGYKTLSWNLGEFESFIDLGTPKVKDAEMHAVEETCNALIRACTTVTPTVVERDDPRLAAARGDPEAVVGPIRIVSIDGIDANMCCGTHVKNLSELQMVKLTHWAPAKGNTRLYFVAGDRARTYLGEMCSRERAMTKASAAGPEKHVEVMQTVKRSEKSLQKSCKNLLKELAVLTAERDAAQASRDKKPFVIHHRADGNNDYLGVYTRTVAKTDPKRLVFASFGAKDEGSFLLVGPDSAVQAASGPIGDLLQAKGGCRGGRYQGRATKMSAATKIGPGGVFASDVKAILEAALEQANATAAAADI